MTRHKFHSTGSSIIMDPKKHKKNPFDVDL